VQEVQIECGEIHWAHEYHQQPSLVAHRQERHSFDVITRLDAPSRRRIAVAPLVVVALAAACAEDFRECPPAAPQLVAQAPAALSQTGLYADIASDTMAPGVVPFTPQFELWSDGAVKRRWMQLPPGGARQSAMRQAVHDTALSADQIARCPTSLFLLRLGVGPPAENEVAEAFLGQFRGENTGQDAGRPAPSGAR
jgi:hypothetical protein